MAGRGNPGRPLFENANHKFLKSPNGEPPPKSQKKYKCRASIQITEENPSTHISKLPPIYHIFEYPESIDQYEPKNDPKKYNFGIETIFHLKESINQRFHTKHRSECCSPNLHWPFDNHRIDRYIKITDSGQYGTRAIDK